MRYKKFINTCLILSLMLFIFVVFRYGYLDSFPLKNIQPTTLERWYKYTDVKFTNNERLIESISIYSQILIYLLCFFAIVIQEQSMKKIKRFFFEFKNIFFSVFILFLWIILKICVYNLDFYKLYMTYLNTIMVSIFMLYFVNSRDVNI